MRLRQGIIAGFFLATAIICVPSAAASAGDDPSPPEAAAPPRAGDRPERIRAADLALQGGRLVEAQALLDDLRDQPGADQADDAQEDQIRLLHAELLLATDQPAEARQWLAALRGPEGQSCRASAALAMAEIATGELAAADTLLRGQEAPCAQDPVFWRALGQASLGLGRPAAAADAYRRALALQPGNDAVRNDLAVVLIATGDAAGAADLLADLLRREPGRQDATINLDFANAMLGRTPQRRVDDSDAFWSRRLQYAGSGARRAGRTGLAEALFAQALIERPRHDQALWRQYSEVAGDK